MAPRMDLNRTQLAGLGRASLIIRSSADLLAGNANGFGLPDCGRGRAHRSTPGQSGSVPISAARSEADPRTQTHGGGG